MGEGGGSSGLGPAEGVSPVLVGTVSPGELMIPGDESLDWEFLLT